MFVREIVMLFRVLNTNIPFLSVDEISYVHTKGINMLTEIKYLVTEHKHYLKNRKKSFSVIQIY